MHVKASFTLVMSALCTACLLGVAVGASTAATPGVQGLEAQVRDAPCGQGKFCGTGTLAGFGKIKTEILFGRPGAPPATGCLGATATRSMTLASDPASTLQLSVKGAACGARAWGTFKIASGSGVFARAKGSGVILGILTKAGGESLRYTGVITIAK